MIEASLSVLALSASVLLLCIAFGIVTLATDRSEDDDTPQAS